MQEPIDISKKVFSEIQEILNKLSKCQSIDELLALEKETTKVQEYCTFLKVYKDFEGKNADINAIPNVNEIENEQKEIKFEEKILTKIDENLSIIEDVVIDDKVDSKIEEVSPIDSEINEVEVLQDLKYAKFDFENEYEIVYPEEETVEKDLLEEKKVEVIGSVSNDFEENTNQKEEVFISVDEAEKLEIKHQEERKFRLSNIKGVKKMETLFEDDFLEENKTFVDEPMVASLTKSNVSLDFMEAEKTKPVFKLDLNDRIAFTKKLFSGSQTDLNNAVSRLNDFETLREAKEYLSEIYYEKGWGKEDEFAQRLWNLVESKFQ